MDRDVDNCSKLWQEFCLSSVFVDNSYADEYLNMHLGYSLEKAAVKTIYIYLYTTYSYLRVGIQQQYWHKYSSFLFCLPQLWYDFRFFFLLQISHFGGLKLEIGTINRLIKYLLDRYLINSFPLEDQNVLVSQILKYWNCDWLTGYANVGFALCFNGMVSCFTFIFYNLACLIFGPTCSLYCMNTWFVTNMRNLIHIRNCSLINKLNK